jgi:hypothetical protein
MHKISNHPHLYPHLT